MPSIRRIISPRRTVLIALCVLLGVATSYAVAWWAVPYNFAEYTHEADWTIAPNRNLFAVSALGWDRITYSTSHSHADTEASYYFRSIATAHWSRRNFFSWDRIDITDPYSGLTNWSASADVSARLRSGLPFRSIYASDFSWLKSPHSIGYLRGREYAYLPLWPGLLANTAIYGSAWFALIAGIATVLPAARARRRRKRGQCVKCAYDRRGIAEHAVCPECGHTVITL